MKKDDLIYVEHIYDRIVRIQKYMQNISMDSFINNEEKREAIERNFEIMGEAASRISEEFKKKYFEVNWKDIKSMRNFLIHDYEEVDMQIMWDTIQNDLPILKPQLEKIIKSNPA